MDAKVLDFIGTNRVCALTTLLPDGSPHAAALHYSHQNDPLKLFFSTESTSRKCQALLGGKPVKAAVVIGLSEEEWVTLQLEGEVRAIMDEEELSKVKAIHYPKHPNSQKFEHDPATIFLEFTPTWWRYTDYNTDPMTILAS